MLKLVLSLLLIGVVVGDQCPPPTLTRPCTCDTAGGLTLLCEDIKSKDVLEGVLRRTGSTHFGNFQLYRASLPSIPVADSLVPKTIVALSVFESNLTTLFDAAPNPSNVVSMLSLESVSFQGGVPWHQFRNLKKLKYLSFFEGDVPSVDSRFKSNVSKSLKLLMLQKTKTGRIEDGVFSEFKALTDIMIDDGQLKELKRSYFARPSILRSLSFEGNQISSLPDDIFSDMPSLRTLSLKKNKLTSLPEVVFGGVLDRLTTLDVSDNPIACDCSIRWMMSREKIAHLKGRCESPKNLKGKPLAELQSSDFGACH